MIWNETLIQTWNLYKWMWNIKNQCFTRDLYKWLLLRERDLERLRDREREPDLDRDLDLDDLREERDLDREDDLDLDLEPGVTTTY